MIRSLLLLLIVPLPAPLKRAGYRYIFGWTIGRRVRIGFSYIDVLKVELDDDAWIGHFNVFRGLNELRIGQRSYLANFNNIFGGRHSPEASSRLIVSDHVNFMSHHFVDVAGTVTIENYATIGGRDTHIWSHSLIIAANGSKAIKTLTVAIGADAYIGARVTLVGCSIPPHAMVGAGSVVTKSFAADPSGGRVLIAGNPAEIRKVYPPLQTVSAKAVPVDS